MPDGESDRARLQVVCAVCVFALVQVCCTSPGERRAQAPAPTVSPSGAPPAPPAPPAATQGPQPATDRTAVSARVPEERRPESEPIYTAKEATERERQQLFVVPIQTGELIGLREWRCLQRHGYESDACKSSNP